MERISSTRESLYTESDKVSLQTNKQINKYCTNFPLALCLTTFIGCLTVAIIVAGIIRFENIDGGNGRSDPLKSGGCSSLFTVNLHALGTTTLPTLASFLKCIETKHVVMTNMYTQSIYEKKQPSTTQRNDLKQFMSNDFFNGIETNTCFSVPSSLKNIYQVWEYTENKISYCMLIEKTANFSSNGYHNRMTFGWPIVIRPKIFQFKQNSSYLHLSAPHISSDANTVSSGGSLFVGINAISYVVQTRIKDALLGYPNCLNESISTGLTDAMNSINELFYDVNLGIINWQLNNPLFHSNITYTSPYPSCQSNNCGFIQWHSTTKQACYDTYISMGSGNYSDYQIQSSSPSSFDYNPAINIKSTFNNYSNSLSTIYHAINPYYNDTCQLYGKNNIIGRYLNYIPVDELCDIDIQPVDFSYLFVTIESQSKFQVISSNQSCPFHMMMQSIIDTY